MITLAELINVGDKFEKDNVIGEVIYRREGDSPFCYYHLLMPNGEWLYKYISLEILQNRLERNCWIKVNNKYSNQMKTTTTVTENHGSGEITHFENKEIFISGCHVGIIILNIRQGTFSLLDVKAGHMSHVDLTYEEMISVLNICKYKSFKGKVVFKQD